MRMPFAVVTLTRTAEEVATPTFGRARVGAAVHAKANTASKSRSSAHRFVKRTLVDSSDEPLTCSWRDMARS